MEMLIVDRLFRDYRLIMAKCLNPLWRMSCSKPKLKGEPNVMNMLLHVMLIRGVQS